MISVRFQSKLFNIMVIEVSALTSNAEEAEVEQFYEDLQDLLELTPPKGVLFIIGDWNAKVGSQEHLAATAAAAAKSLQSCPTLCDPIDSSKFGLGIQNKTGQRLIESCQENALVIANTLFQQYKRRLYIWTSPNAQH